MNGRRRNGDVSFINGLGLLSHIYHDIALNVVCGAFSVAFYVTMMTKMTKMAFVGIHDICYCIAY